jgi:hypothetical protein
MPILAPCSNNGLNSDLLRTASCITFDNRVPGQNPFLQNLNGHNFDPNKTFVLNPAAWSDPGAGNWGFGAPYYNDYRYQRRPGESLSLSIVLRAPLQVARAWVWDQSARPRRCRMIPQGTLAASRATADWGGASSGKMNSL